MSAPKQSGERPIPCPPEVLTLVEHFERNRDDYKSGQYNEAQLRQQFLNPLFEALGWDMANRAGYAEAYKEVIHEDAIKIGQETKAPDYCFRIGGARKFFLEAKKPSVFIKEEIPPAFQLRRYAWSAKLPLSLLCDFEEFAVYDTRIKPDRNDKASTARINYFTYKDYAEKWGEIVSVFSRDAVLKGSFDKYAETTRLKKGTATVDDAFLTEIEDWRDLLAKNIALRNADLTTRELNFAVQRTIDRIVFLRICEDRGIEEYGRLQALQNRTNAYKRLVQLFSQADDRYNSGLFHFQKEKDRHEEPDTLTTKIEIDDKPLKEIIKRLYYPDSPYEFSVLSADILGQVYEQFLGKVIRLTAGHQAKVEEKPEVRKAGGVYYTPKYIVDYIVKNTVGHLVGAQTNADVCPVGAALRGRPNSGQPHGVAPTMDDEERLRINAFDWEKEFSEIMKADGFDAVIGNPPYGAEFPESTNTYMKNRFATFVLRGESYLVFIEKAIELLKKSGLFGHIVPDTYLYLGFTQPLRDHLLQNTKLREIVSLPSKVFSGATVDTTLLFAEKAERAPSYHKYAVLVRSFNKKKVISSVSQSDRMFSISTEAWHKQKAFNVSSDNSEALLINKIEKHNNTIEDVADMFSGIKVYEVGKGDPPQTAHIRDTKLYTSERKENKSFQPFFDGKHIGRYKLLWDQNNWVKYGPWLAAPRNPENFEDGKILIRKIVGETLIATHIPETSYCNTLLHVLKIKPHANLRYRFLLGILNSRFIGWYFSN